MGEFKINSRSVEQDVHDTDTSYLYIMGFSWPVLYDKESVKFIEYTAYNARVQFEKREVQLKEFLDKKVIKTQSKKISGAEQEELDQMYQIYISCGYQVLLTSAEQEEGISQIRKILEGKTTVVAGPSGVGKSSLTNLLQEEVSMETGEISKKLKRGRHTTRHAQLLTVGEHTYLMDTPGFSSLFVERMEKEELRFHYPEFVEYEGKCRFQGCVHVHEPECAVKQAVEEGKIHRQRYENYVSFYEELKEQEKRRY